MSMLLRKYHDTSEPEPVPEPERVEKPAKSDSREAWADYAVAEGHNEGSLEELTKKQIQSLFE